MLIAATLPAQAQNRPRETIQVGLIYVAEDAGFNNLGAAADYVPEWQFTVYNVNGDRAKANARKVEGFLRAILRATD